MTPQTTPESAEAGPRRRMDQPDDLSQALLDISSLFESPEPLDAVLRKIVQITSELMQMPICSIYLIEPDGTLRKRSNVGLDQDLKQQATFRLGEGVPGWVAQHGKLVALPDLRQDPRYAAHPNPDPTPHAYICAPLRTKEQIIGALSARIMRVKNFTRTECRVFHTVARMIAIVIEKQRLIEERLRNQHLAAVVVSLSEIAHYAKNVMFTASVAEKTVGNAMERTPSLESVVPSWQALKRANQRIRKLVSDMLTYSRERRLQFVDTPLDALIASAADDLRDYAAGRGVTINADFDPQVGTVKMDPDVMADVILNLITNAIDAVPEGQPGHVTVRTRRLADGPCLIEVQDDGAGIPPEIRRKVFHLFFSTKGQHGTGIGLAATRKAVEKHGGRIDFESEVGRGTTFRVTLPPAPPCDLPADPAAG